MTVLAYGIGEEGFTDKNGDGYEEGLTLLKADGQPNLGSDGKPLSLSPDETEAVDANDRSTSLGEAWVDYNENNIHDASEPFIDFNSNAQWDDQDGLYNGVLCKYDDPTKPNWCNTTTKNINVRSHAVIVMSGTGAYIKATTTDPTGNPDIFNTNAVNSIALDACTDGTKWTPAETKLYLQITDLHGNAMPGGTLVEAATTNGKIVLAPVSPLLDSAECVFGDSQFGSNCPLRDPPNYTKHESVRGATLFEAVLTSDATQDDTFACSNTSTTGYLTITVTTPVSHQVATVLAIGVSD